MAANTFCSQIKEKLTPDYLVILTESSGKTIFIDIGSHLRDEAGLGCWIDIKFLWSLMDIFDSRIILGRQYLEQVTSITIDFDRMQLGIEMPIKVEEVPEASGSSPVTLTLAISGGVIGITLIAFGVWRFLKYRKDKLRNELWMYDRQESF